MEKWNDGLREKMIFTQYSSIPLFQFPIVPLFRSPIIPLFHHSIIPIFSVWDLMA